MPNRIESDPIKVVVKVDRNKPVWVTGGAWCYHERECSQLNRSSKPIVELPKGKALDLGYEQCSFCHR